MMASNGDVRVRPLPRLCPKSLAGEEWGGVSRPSVDRLIVKHAVETVSVLGRTMIPAAEVERVVAELCAASAADKGAREQAREKAKRLSERAVAARRTREQGAGPASARTDSTT